MPKAKSLKKRGGSCQVNFPISKSPCFDVDVSQYKSPCKHLPLDSAQIKAQTGGKKSARKNKKRNLRKSKKSLKKRKQKGGEGAIAGLDLEHSERISRHISKLQLPKNNRFMTDSDMPTKIENYFKSISQLNDKIYFLESKVSRIEKDSGFPLRDDDSSNIESEE